MSNFKNYFSFPRFSRKIILEMVHGSTTMEITIPEKKKDPFKFLGKMKWPITSHEKN